MEEFKVIDGIWLSGITVDSQFISFKVHSNQDLTNLLAGSLISGYHVIIRKPGMANMYLPGYLGVSEPMAILPGHFLSLSICNEATQKSLDEGIQGMFDKKKQEASGLVLPDQGLVRIQK